MNDTTKGNKRSILILVLGSLTAIGPFSIDMYLPGFPAIAKDLGTNTSMVALSLSSYFIGISAGQLLYGPLMDRFGRKPPLYAGLIVYIIASVGCMFSSTIEMLIGWRLIQAIGCCAAAVGATVMVRDLFPVNENPRIFALLMLVLGTSPMVAPTIGGYVTATLGWQRIFLILAILGICLVSAVRLLLPVSYQPDPSYSLKPGPIIRNFRFVLSQPQFITYALAGSLAFAGLFVYVSGSPQVFMEIFKLGGKVFGWIFALLSVGFVGSGQVSTLLLKKYTSQQIVYTSLLCQSVCSVIFLVLSVYQLVDLYATILYIFIFLFCLGMMMPNASALALAPFSTNAGSASSLLGVFQMTTGAMASTGISLFHATTTTPMILVMSISSFLALTMLVAGRCKLKNLVS